MKILDGHIFRCRCGSDEFVPVSYNGESHSFYEGNFMCSKCGTSLSALQPGLYGEINVLNYFSPEFNRSRPNLQLTFSF